MIEQKKPAVLAAGIGKFGLTLSDLRIVPDSYFSIRRFYCKPCPWGSSFLRRQSWGSVAFNARRRRLEAAPGVVWTNRQGALTPSASPYLSMFWAAFSSSPLPSNKSSRRYFPRSAEATRNHIKNKTAGVNRRGESTSQKVRMSL